MRKARRGTLRAVTLATVATAAFLLAALPAAASQRFAGRGEIELAFTPRDAAKAWSKLLESAVANAEHNHELVGEELRVAAAYADEGPTLKRFRPRAMGRATRIRKRTSHLTIMLAPKSGAKGGR